MHFHLLSTVVGEEVVLGDRRLRLFYDVFKEQAVVNMGSLLRGKLLLMGRPSIVCVERHERLALCGVEDVKVNFMTLTQIVPG